MPANADTELRDLYREHLGERARELMAKLAGEKRADVNRAVREYLDSVAGGRER